MYIWYQVIVYSQTTQVKLQNLLKQKTDFLLLKKISVEGEIVSILCIYNLIYHVYTMFCYGLLLLWHSYFVSFASTSDFDTSTGGIGISLRDMLKGIVIGSRGIQNWLMI